MEVAYPGNSDFSSSLICNGKTSKNKEQNIYIGEKNFYFFSYIVTR